MSVGALNNIKHLAFAAAAAVYPGRAHGDDIAVHQPTHLARIQHKIAFAGGGERHGKAKAVFMGFDAAFHHRQLFGHAHRATAVDVHLAVACHGTQAALEKRHFVIADRQQRSQCVYFHRHAFAFQ